MPDTDRLAEIRRRELAATDGPWAKSGTETGDAVVYVARTTEEGTAYAHTLFEADWGVDADAEFVAAARSDIPYLLDALDQMTAERNELAAMVQTLSKAPGVNQTPDCADAWAQQDRRVKEEL